MQFEEAQTQSLIDSKIMEFEQRTRQAVPNGNFPPRPVGFPPGMPPRPGMGPPGLPQPGMMGEPGHKPTFSLLQAVHRIRTPVCEPFARIWATTAHTMLALRQAIRPATPGEPRAQRAQHVGIAGCRDSVTMPAKGVTG
jgi:hypothetical protein